MGDLAFFRGAVECAYGAEKLRMKEMKLRATRTLAGELLKLGKAGIEAAIDTAAKANGPGGGAEQIRIKLPRPLEGGDAFLERGGAAADHVGVSVVPRAQGNPRGSVAGIKRDGFLQQGDGLLVVLDVVGGILAAQVEIVGLLVFGFG